MQRENSFDSQFFGHNMLDSDNDSDIEFEGPPSFKMF